MEKRHGENYAETLGVFVKFPRFASKIMLRICSQVPPKKYDYCIIIINIKKNGRKKQQGIKHVG